MEVGQVFILCKRPDGSKYGIPEEDFGRQMVVTQPPKFPLGSGRAAFTDGRSHCDLYRHQRGWYVYPDMMGPTGGPW